MPPTFSLLASDRISCTAASALSTLQFGAYLHSRRYLQQILPWCAVCVGCRPAIDLKLVRQPDLSSHSSARPVTATDACSRSPSARTILSTVLNSGLPLADSALFRLSLPSPASSATAAIRRARAISPSVAISGSDRPLPGRRSSRLPCPLRSPSAQPGPTRGSLSLTCLLPPLKPPGQPPKTVGRSHAASMSVSAKSRPLYRSGSRVASARA